MDLTVVDSEERQSKLDKQRDLLIKKRKQKHAHQVLSLHEKSLKAAVGTAPRSPKSTKHSERTAAEQNSYAYDGPQSYNLGNPDLIETPSVQVLRIARSPSQNSNSPRKHNSDGEQPEPPRPSTRPSPKPSMMRFSEEPAKQAFHSPIRPMKLPLPAVTDADDQQHLFAAADDRVTFPDTASHRDSPRSRETRRTSAPRRPQPPRTNNLVHSKPEESTKNNCVSSSLVQEFTLPSDSSPSWMEDISQPSDAASKITGSIPNSSPCVRLRKTSNQKNSHNKKNGRKNYLKKTHSDDSKAVEETLASASNIHAAVGDKISRKPTKKETFEPEDDVESFVICPAPKGTKVRCRISRDKRGVDRGFFPTYFLHLERDDGRRFFLLAARRRRRSTTSNYVISFDATDLSRSSCRMAGKVRANFVGTHFTVYDFPSTKIVRGGMTERSESEVVATPGRSSIMSGSIPPSPREAREVAAIIYDPNILGFKGPRKMTVIIPKMDEDGNMMNIYSDNDSCLLLDQWRKRKTYAIMELRNKTPVWNEDTQSYVLNFHGRVTQASVKNFQIVPKADENNVLMQFGRVSEDVFSMDFEYPLCALQAFGIALSSFDGKLACE
uniref:Tubby-like protein n=2 Tax=Schistocephalus solidus TaxID=70667 RepID=A0A0X3NN03_SCHSO